MTCLHSAVWGRGNVLSEPRSGRRKKGVSQAESGTGPEHHSPGDRLSGTDLLSVSRDTNRSGDHGGTGHPHTGVPRPQRQQCPPAANTGHPREGWRPAAEAPEPAPVPALCPVPGGQMGERLPPSSEAPSGRAAEGTRSRSSASDASRGRGGSRAGASQALADGPQGERPRGAHAQGRGALPWRGV